MTAQGEYYKMYNATEADASGVEIAVQTDSSFWRDGHDRAEEPRLDQEKQEE